MIISVLYVTHTSMKIGPICFSNVINFSYSVWNYLQIDRTHGSDVQQCIYQARSRFGHPLFFEFMLMAAWNICILRNGRTFRGERASFATWKCKFVHDIHLLAHRPRDSIKQ